MPELLSKTEALKLLEKQHQPGECLICKMNDSGRFKLLEDKTCIVHLSEYPRFWGHVIVAMKKHTEKYTDVSETENAALYKNAYKTAKVLEKLLNPSRCYIASIGSGENRINTCPHINVHVIPVYDKAQKPSEVFTWENGLFSGTKKEWENIYTSLKTGLSDF